MFEQIGWNKPFSLFEQYVQEQQSGKRDSFVAKLGNERIGYVCVHWESEHPYFLKRKIPEIKDLNILPLHRGFGFGKKLLQYAQNHIASRSKTIGIGVGLTADYGPAQRLYIQQGYIPNGEGATQNHQALKYGDVITVNDDTVLWMTKEVT